MCIQLPDNILRESISEWTKFSDLKNSTELPNYSVYFVTHSNEDLSSFNWCQDIIHIGMCYKAKDNGKLKSRIAAFGKTGYRDKYRSNYDCDADEPTPPFNANTFYYAYIMGESISQIYEGTNKHIIRGIVLYLEQIAFSTYKEFHSNNVPMLNRRECE